jgi:hypothetical protein
MCLTEQFNILQQYLSWVYALYFSPIIICVIK